MYFMDFVPDYLTSDNVIMFNSVYNSFCLYYYFIRDQQQKPQFNDPYKTKQLAFSILPYHPDPALVLFPAMIYRNAVRIDLTYDKVLGYYRSFAFVKDLVKEPIILCMGEGIRVFSGFPDHIRSPHHRRMPEDIPEMHPPYDLPMFGRSLIPEGPAGGKVLKNAPAPHHIDPGMGLQEPDLLVKAIADTDVSAIQSGYITEIVVLFQPFQAGIQCLGNTFIGGQADDLDGKLSRQGRSKIFVVQNILAAVVDDQDHTFRGVVGNAFQ